MFNILTKNDYDQYCRHINTNVAKDYFDYFVNNVINDNHIIILLKIDDQIVASGTLIIEHKLTYGGCKLGHIENILTDEHHRGKGYGSTLINYLIQTAKDNGCYRVDLICKHELVPFYKKIVPEAIEQSGMTIMIPENYK